MIRITAAIALPSRSMAYKYSPNLAWSQPQRVPPSWLDHGLPVHLWVHSIPESNCISELARSWPPSALLQRDGEYIFGRPLGRYDPIFIWSYHTTIIHTLSFPTFGLTPLFRDFVNSCNCTDTQCRVVLYLFTCFLCSSRQNRSFSRIPFGCRERCGGMIMACSLCLLSLLFHHNGLQVVHLQGLSMGVSRCSSDHAWLPSVARLTIRIYLEILK